MTTPASRVTAEKSEVHTANLPCPFCGSPVDPEGWSSIDRKGPACTNGECDGAAENMEVWNKRVPDAETLEALRWATVLITAHVKPEKCVHINGEMKSAKDIFGLLTDVRAKAETRS